MNYEDFADWLDKTDGLILLLIVAKNEAPIFAELLRNKADRDYIVRTSAEANVRELAYKLVRTPKEGWVIPGGAYS